MNGRDCFAYIWNFELKQMIQLPEKNVPRWMIFLIDIGICVFALMLAYLIRFDFVGISAYNLNQEWEQLKWTIPVYLLIRGGTFYFLKTYQGIIRFTSTEDAKRIVIAVIIGSVLLGLLSPIRALYFDGYYLMPRPVIIIEFFIALFLLIVSRFSVKLLYLERKKKGKERKNVLIYGAGELGLILKRTLERDPGVQYNIVAFVDEDGNKVGKRMEGTPVQSSHQLESILRKETIDQVIIGVLKPKRENKQRIVDTCLEHGVATFSVPPIERWINGELSSNQIRPVKIEDLLGRKEIKLSKDKIAAELKGKIVLITGAAGSIGSEIVRQVIPFNPKKIILLDQAESPLYDLSNELKLIQQGVAIELVIGDVAHEQRMRNVFKAYQPQYVFHAAAYKHVPLMEENPSEAVNTNVGGSKILADLAHAFSIEKFVMISTDKAVNPTNVMGATKRVAEMYCQSLNRQSKTKYITTRFGNVLGSNGSVIPLFRRQISNGGPVTVTHPEVTRFFMTIPEACQLVLEAGNMGEGGEIFVFDMGDSVRIMDLAEKMIRLSGLELNKDIEIKITGLRPGEKLYEELLNNEENTLPTHHNQILIGKVRPYDFEAIKQSISELIHLYASQDNRTMVQQLKQLVPEFISNNSQFSELDQTEKKA